MASSTSNAASRVEAALLDLVAASASLPKFGEDYELYSSTSETFRKRTKAIADRASAVLRTVAKGVNIADEEKLYLLAADLREQAHAQLDESKGLSGATEKVQVSAPKVVIKNADLDGKRPQDSFYDAPVDNSRTPFKPRLKSKPNAIVPLGQLRPELPQELPPDLAAHLQSLGKADAVAAGFYRNPYEDEIKVALEEKSPGWLWGESIKFPLRKRVPIIHSRKKNSGSSTQDSLELVPFKYVDSEETFDDMLTHLENGSHEAIAVDLEHHSLRSFQGFTCVMQISTIERDFVIDAIAMRKQLTKLLPVFSNPDIVKVLHGADSDVEWLQRDFGLYITQMFDTGQAARLLGYESASLAYAMDRHAQVVANKAYQLADWRLRPLTADMLKYAREDTHFLLGIFDAMRIELVKLGKQKRMDAVQKVLERSADIASKTYEKVIYTPKAYMELVLPGDSFSATELQVLAALYEWRDAVAREEDESLEFVLSNRGLLRLAKSCPRGPEALVKELDGVKSSSIVRQRLADVVKLIEDAVRGKTAPVPEATVPPISPVPRASVPVRAPTPKEQGYITKQQTEFSLGVNGRRGTFNVPATVTFSSQPEGHIQVPKLAAGKITVEDGETDSHQMAKVTRAREEIRLGELRELKSRMKGIEEVKQKVDDLLGDIKEDQPKGDVKLQNEEKVFPKSLSEKFSMKSSSSRPQYQQVAVEDEADETSETAPQFQYTRELAEKVGAIRPQASEEQPKKRPRFSRGRDEGETTVLRAGSSGAGAASNRSGGKPVKKEQKQNPYVLKPSRQPAQSLSYLPK